MRSSPLRAICRKVENSCHIGILAVVLFPELDPQRYQSYQPIILYALDFLNTMLPYHVSSCKQGLPYRGSRNKTMLGDSSGNLGEWRDILIMLECVRSD